MVGGFSLTTSPGAAHLSPTRGGPGSLRPPVGPCRSTNLDGSLSLSGMLGGGMLGGGMFDGGMLWGPVITLAKSGCCRGIGGSGS